MLDLSNLNDKLYEIKWIDGVVYKLKKPTQKLFIEMNKVGNLTQQDIDTTEMLNAVYSIVTNIMNLNTDNHIFTIEEIGEVIDFDTASLIITDYLKETTEALKK